MADIFAGGHLRYLNGAWRDDNGDPVEIEQVVHAHWEFDDFSSPNLKCSACGGLAPMDCCGDYHSERTERCPHCGAHMDEEVADGT